MRTGAGTQIAAVLYQIHAPAVDLFIALGGIFHGIPRFCEGRGIQDHHVELPALPFQLRQQFKHIRARKCHPVRQAVEGRIFRGLIHTQLGSVHTQHTPCSCQSRIQRKGTRMGKAVQHRLILTERCRRPPVVFLIQEKSGLLAFLYVHIIAHTIFLYFHLGIECRADKALHPLHALLGTHLGVAALIDAPDGDAVLRQHFDQCLYQEFLPPVNAQRQRLYHDHIRKLVRHETRQEICLPKDQAAAVGVHHGLAVFPAVPHPLLHKAFRDLMLLFPGKHPDADLGIHVDEPITKKIAVKIFHGYNVSIFKGTVHPCDLVVIDPQAPCFQGSGLSSFDSCNCITHLSSSIPKFTRITSAILAHTVPVESIV